jgi:formylglycine-generating enzyme required for sulfatase activity
MKDVLTGRVDLVRALAAGGAELQEAMARLLGLERLAPEPPETIRVVGEENAPVIPAPIAEPPAPVADTPLVPFWYADTFASHEPLVPGDEIVSPTEPTEDDAAIAVHSPLASGAAILTRLRRVSAFSRTSGEPDVERIVEQLSRGRFLEVLPRRSRKSWGQSIQCIVDRHRRLAPYWTDQDEVVQTLSRVYPRDGFQVAILMEGASRPCLCWPRRDDAYPLPEPGTTVVVLGDLGCLDGDGVRARESWIERGRRYHEHGNRPVALVPCDPASVPEELTRAWTIIPWESTLAAGKALSAKEAGRVAERILTLLAFALRVEPWLIREVRRLLPEGRRDAGIESRVWQHEAFQSRHSEAASFRPEKAQELRAKIAAQPAELRRKVYELTRRLRQGNYPGVWYAELLGLEGEAAEAGLLKDDLDQAAWWFQSQRGIVKRGGPEGDQATWFRRVLPRLPRSAYQGKASVALHKIWSLVESPDDRPPDGLDPARLPLTDDIVRMIELRQVAGGLAARAASGSPPVHEPRSASSPPGSSVGLIRTRGPWIKVDSFEDRPAWASAWGKDRYGFWCAFRVEGVRQRLRWIPAGEFVMGSPEEEAGRFNDEGPQHAVRISRGFWLFDTPCTQALWEAVMGQNPSEFRSLTRPVEHVSWEDCQAFVKRLNGLLEGLNLSLPSEAQWEYACRAGTTKATYAGDLKILGVNDAPLLDEIAWYGGNCGVGYELAEGYDMSSWPQKQYDSKTGGSRSVGGKAPNGWGLYDMLGNVWEWCQDGWDAESYAKSLRDDPITPAEAFADRVIRGGSWYAYAKDVRAASRNWKGPDGRDRRIGFRCGEFQSSGPVSAGKRVDRGESRSERSAEQRSDGESPSETRWLGLGDREAGPWDFPGLTTVRLSSDVEELTIRTMTRPDWTSAIGRDAFGLWAEFTIQDTVRQRLRWIPPGRFVMGAPPEEAGRYDDEGPQRTMRISQGFWLFDTPCTQTLWEAVIGGNPSRFLSPTRPVEQVSWDDCQAFVKQLNSKLEGLELSLPSEAQWEYACRAGTTGATYAGDLEILGANMALLLDGIAWYGGNCGVDYELTEGFDISFWREKQYDFKLGGTHPVGGKVANGWGLYDMLGNVWEWCLDEYRGDPDASRRAAAASRLRNWTTGWLRQSAWSGSASASAARVHRGGAWYSNARYVRAASRNGYAPGYRNHDLGFRCGEYRAGELSEG